MKNIQIGEEHLKFNGEDNYVEVPHSETLKLTTGFTFDIMVHCTVPAGVSQIMTFFRKSTTAWTTEATDIDFQWGWGNDVRFSMGSKQIALNETRFGVKRFTAIYDGIAGEMRVYIDGVLRGTLATDVSTVEVNNASVFIGGDNTAIARKFGGMLHNAKLWNRALTTAEIQRNDVQDASLVGHWKMDELSGSIAVDSSGYGNDGTIYGNAVWGAKEVDELTLWDGTKHRKIIGSVMTSEGLKDFYRPINFKDNFGSKENISLYSKLSSLTSPVIAGNTTLPVKNTNGFYANTVITITDGINREHVNVFEVYADRIVTSPLKNSYSGFAFVGRTTAIVTDTININNVGSIDVDIKTLVDSGVHLNKQVAFVDDFDTLNYAVSSATYEVTDGVFNAISTTVDPMIHMEALGSFNPSIFRFVEMRYKINNGGQSLWEIFFTNDLYAGAHGAHHIGGGLLDFSGAWHSVFMDGWQHIGWKTNGNIRGWRLDFATNPNIDMSIDYVKLTNYSSTHIPVHKTSEFSIGQELVISEGTLNEQATITGIEDGYLVLENPLVNDFSNEATISVWSHGFLPNNSIFYLHLPNHFGSMEVKERVNDRVGELVNFTDGNHWVSEGLQFNGIDEYVEFGDILDMGFNSLVVSVIVKTTSTGVQNVLSKFATSIPEGYGVRITSGYPRMIIRRSDNQAINFQGSIFVADGQWHEITYEFDRKGMASIYVDGVLDTAMDISSYQNENISSPVTLKIGAMENPSVGVSNLFEGIIKTVNVRKLPNI